ncbi:MAG: thioredoxin family protein [Campylobacterales bacterium]
MNTLKRNLLWMGPLFVTVLLFFALFSGEKISWESRYQNALDRADREGKTVLMFVSSESCPWCTRMKRETLSDARVIEAINEGFVPLFLEAPAGREEFAKSGLQVDGVPATLLIDAQGREFGRIEGFLAPEAFLERLSLYR